MVVLKGSWATRRPNKSMPARYQSLRRSLIEANIIASDGEGELCFTTDHTFDNPSEAACVVQGGSRNGFECWKDAAGRSLQDRGWCRAI